MEGDARRQELLRLISKSQKPISGTELAQTLHVSRQVIVQDVALLRASKYPIFATNRGMSCYKTIPTMSQGLSE